MNQQIFVQVENNWVWCHWMNLTVSIQFNRINQAFGEWPQKEVGRGKIFCTTRKVSPTRVIIRGTKFGSVQSRSSTVTVALKKWLKNSTNREKWTTNTIQTANTESTNRKRLKNGSPPRPHLSQERSNRKEKSDAIELYTQIYSSCFLNVNMDSQFFVSNTSFSFMMK